MNGGPTLLSTDGSGQPSHPDVSPTPLPFWARRATDLYTLGAATAAFLASRPPFRPSSWTKGGVQERRGRNLPLGPSRPIWIHAASMGEVRVGGYFAEALAARDLNVIASAMTETGYVLCRGVYPVGTTSFRVPFDLPGPVGRAFGHFQPRAIILVETEWWPNLLRHAGRVGLPVFVINGRISERTFRRYRLMAPYWRAVLRGVRFFYMRSDADAERLMALGVEPERVAAFGTLKVGVTAEGASSPATNAPLTLDGPIWIAGCTRPGEEEIVLTAFHKLRREFPGLRLWVAPRHPERFDEVAGRMKTTGLQFARWSEMGADNGLPGQPLALIDRMGLLARLYAHASVVFVGGSLLSYGGHNPLEPALTGAPVIFGPHMNEQRESARLLVEEGLATEVADGPSLAEAVARVLRAPLSAASRAHRAAALLASIGGVRERIVDDMLTRLDAPTSADRSHRKAQ